MDISKEIMEVLKKTLTLEESSVLDEDRRLEDLGLDSVNLVNFVVGCEKKFGIEIADEDLLFEKFATITKVKETINKYMGK